MNEPYTFDVTGMSCQHCVQAITRAVQRIDPLAQVNVDLPRGQVHVQSTTDRAALVQVITDEGYSVRT